ncbi:MAG: DmsE family decaheme c-type cytochrome [Armatimonadota bacterium]
MKYVKMTCFAIALAVTCLLCAWHSKQQAVAQEKSEYVGSEMCASCHADTYKEWALTTHRKTLFNEEPSKTGCEACHGPGGEHVAGGGDKTKIIKLSKQKPDQVAATCLKCHKQEHVTLWQSSLHARSKVTCIDCHNPHSPDTAMMSKDIDNGKIALEGLTRSIKASELAANDAAAGSEEKEKANAEVTKLKAEANALRDKIKASETVYNRVAEPYICYNCHKAQQIQMKMPSHHPVPENKMKCSDCHNPHGGPDGMLKAESVNETCFKCHAEKLGPFTFEHPPVTEDCATCHNPHGSVQNNLLVQSEPFLCLKCHVGPHSRSGTLGKPEAIPEYYTECTDCHSQVHGSDEHSALHY